MSLFSFLPAIPTIFSQSIDFSEFLLSQELGPVWPSNPIKYAIRGALAAGVPANTLVLLLLLPLVASVIAAARHLLGVRGFGIFLPSALSIVFVAVGPLIGIGLFLLIVSISTLARITLRKLKVRLQYLPRMALILWLVVLGVLAVFFLASLWGRIEIAKIDVFALLILALLAEDFTRVQIGKSIKTAVNLTGETMILSLVAYVLFTFGPLREFALLRPEALLASVAIFDLVVGRYAGLRLMEVWRFRKMIKT